MSTPRSVPAEGTDAPQLASAKETGALEQLAGQAASAKEAGSLEAATGKQSLAAGSSLAAEPSLGAEQSTAAEKSLAAAQSGDVSRGWIAVDLDGTLAYYHSWRGLEHIGKPVKSMLERVRRWREEGYEVRIFTARASSAELIPPVEAWLKKHKLGGLKVTNELDADCLELWDDRCVQLLPDTGMPVRSPSLLARPKAPMLEEAFPHEGRPQLKSETADT